MYYVGVRVFVSDNWQKFIHCRAGFVIEFIGGSVHHLFMYLSMAIDAFFCPLKSIGSVFKCPIILFINFHLIDAYIHINGHRQKIININFRSLRMKLIFFVRCRLD